MNWQKKDQGFSSQVNTIIDDKANGKDDFFSYFMCDAETKAKTATKKTTKYDPYGIAKNAKNA